MVPHEFPAERLQYVFCTEKSWKPEKIKYIHFKRSTDPPTFIFIIFQKSLLFHNSSLTNSIIKFHFGITFSPIMCIYPRFIHSTILYGVYCKYHLWQDSSRPRNPSKSYCIGTSSAIFISHMLRDHSRPRKTLFYGWNSNCMGTSSANFQLYFTISPEKRHLHAIFIVYFTFGRYLRPIFNGVYCKYHMWHLSYQEFRHFLTSIYPNTPFHGPSKHLHDQFDAQPPELPRVSKFLNGPKSSGDEEMLQNVIFKSPFYGRISQI